MPLSHRAAHLPERFLKLFLLDSGPRRNIHRRILALRPFLLRFLPHLQPLWRVDELNNALDGHDDRDTHVDGLVLEGGRVLRERVGSRMDIVVAVDEAKQIEDRADRPNIFRKPNIASHEPHEPEVDEYGGTAETPYGTAL